MSAELPDFWKLMPLQDVMEAIIDYRGKTPEKSETGIPLITAKIVKNGRIEEPTEFIAEELFSGWMVRGLPEDGDVVVTTEAPLGEVAQLYDAKVALAQRIVTLRGKKGVLNNDFLLYLLQTKFVQDQLEARASGSTVKGIKQSELRKVLLPLPPEGEQIKIARHLKTVDIKIELNRQINQTLEQITQVVFKSWFVDFELVKAKVAAKAEDRDPERTAMCAISGKSDTELDQLPSDQHQQLAITAALFPDELVESELGLIPKGWGIGQLDDITNYLNRGISPSYVEEGGVLVLNQKCVRDNSLDFAQARRHDFLKRKIDGRELKVGDVLINSTGVGTLGRVAQVLHLPEKAIVDSHVTVARANERISWNFLGLALQRRQAEIEQLGEGSTGQTELSRAKLSAITTIIPPMAVIQAFDSITLSSREMFVQNLLQNMTLTETRDSLLPKLLSGELCVSGAV